MKCLNRNNWNFKRGIFFIVAVFFLISSNQKAISQEKKVLFLGNSYTAVNNLPSLVSGLALSAGKTIYTDKNTPGGYTLAYPSNGHLYNQTSLIKIAEKDWDYVVLQEQSQFPVVEFFRDNYTYPGAIDLDSIIRDKHECSKTLFYMTWGRKYGGEQCIDGQCSVDFVDYAHMQDSLASAYLSMSNYLQTPVSPVGIAWKKSIVENGDPIELFSGDGSHPSLAGSYLTACTFFATIYVESPVGLSYTAGLSESDAAYLQNIAAETVLNNLELWNIDTTTVSSAFEYDQNGGEVTFNNTSSGADSFLWDFGNGDIDTIANPVYTYLESGSYHVSLVASSGCKVDTSFSIIDIVISNINQSVEQVIKSVYPNPAKDYIIVNYNLLKKYNEPMIRIVDISGKVHSVVNINRNSNTINLNIESLDSGIYFINMYSKNKRIGMYRFQK